MSVKTACVTGGGGFIGRHLVENLHAQGWQIRVIDPTPKPDGMPETITWIQKSILDPTALEQAVTGASHVFHLAALTHLWIPDSSQYEKINFEGTRRVLSACRAASIERLVYTSTEVILRGWKNKSSEPLTESDPLPRLADMAGPYCRSKFLAEQAVRTAVKMGLPAVIVYPTVPLGPGDINMTAPSAMIEAFLTSPPPAYLDCVLNMVGVEDVAQGHILAAEVGQIGGRYILGGDNLNMAALMTQLAKHTEAKLPRRTIPYALAAATAYVSEGLAKLTGQTPLASIEGVRLARHKTYIDNTHARTALGWDVAPVDAALARAAAWLKSRTGDTSSQA